MRCAQNLSALVVSFNKILQILKVMRNLNFEVLRHVVEIETNPKGNERREKKTPLDTIARRFEL